MSFKINLIKKRVTNIQRRKRLQWLIQIISIVVLGVFFVISSAVLSYFYFLKKETENLEAKIAQEASAVKSLEEKETKVVYLDKKLNALSSIFELQAAQQKQVEAVFALIPEGVSISDVVFLEKQKVELAGEALDFSSFEDFFGNLTSLSSDSREGVVLTGAYVSNVEQTEKGRYSFVMTLGLKES